MNASKFKVGDRVAADSMVVGTGWVRIRGVYNGMRNTFAMVGDTSCPPNSLARLVKKKHNEFYVSRQVNDDIWEECSTPYHHKSIGYEVILVREILPKKDPTS